MLNEVDKVRVKEFWGRFTDSFLDFCAKSGKKPVETTLDMENKTLTYGPEVEVTEFVPNGGSATVKCNVYKSELVYVI